MRHQPPKELYASLPASVRKLRQSAGQRMRDKSRDEFKKALLSVTKKVP